MQTRAVIPYTGLHGITKLRLLLLGYGAEELVEGYYSAHDPVESPEFNEEKFLEYVGGDAYKSLLKRLDPIATKEQDHYEVLGLRHLRSSATDEHIKYAHRRIVLSYHPDKTKSCPDMQHLSGSDYFTCITKAAEILSNATKRKAYDSIDPTFDDSLPSSTCDVREFFKVYAKAFDANSRWSVKQPVPSLGGPFDVYDSVDNFYAFWYDFDSWREYSYLDEEDKEKAECREERKYLEKLNKAERARRKKAEMTRIRQLVDAAYDLDPRVRRFKAWSKAEKEEKKKARQAAAKRRAEEEKRLVDEVAAAERAVREEKERLEKERADADKKVREANKQALKRERKRIRTLAKNNNFFIKSSTDHDSERKCAARMVESEELLARSTAEQLQSLCSQLEACLRISTSLTHNNNAEVMCNGMNGSPDLNDENSDRNKSKAKKSKAPKQKQGAENSNAVHERGSSPSEDSMAAASEVFQRAINEMEAEKVREREEATRKAQEASKEKEKAAGGGSVRAWDVQTREMLVKAVNLFPAGTVDRWEVVAEYMNQHCAGLSVTARQALKNAKDLQKIDPNDKKAVQGDAYSHFTASHRASAALEKTITQEHSEATVRAEDKPVEACEPSKPAAVAAAAPRTWTADEQKMLEQALKSYGPETPDRWDAIARCVPSRTRKECMKRFKELAEAVKAKKALKERKAASSTTIPAKS